MTQGRAASSVSDISPAIFCPGIRQPDYEHLERSFDADLRGADARHQCGPGAQAADGGFARPMYSARAGAPANVHPERQPARRCQANGPALRRLLENEIAVHFGFVVDVIVRTAAIGRATLRPTPSQATPKPCRKCCTFTCRAIRLSLAPQSAEIAGAMRGSGSVQPGERCGSTMGRTVSRARNSARFSSTRPAVRRRPAVTEWMSPALRE